MSAPWGGSAAILAATALIGGGLAMDHPDAADRVVAASGCLSPDLAGQGRISWVPGSIASVRLAVEAADGCVSWTHSTEVGFRLRPGPGDSRTLTWASARAVRRLTLTVRLVSPATRAQSATVVLSGTRGTASSLTWPRFVTGSKRAVVLGTVAGVTGEFTSLTGEATP